MSCAASLKSAKGHILSTAPGGGHHKSCMGLAMSRHHSLPLVLTARSIFRSCGQIFVDSVAHSFGCALTCWTNICPGPCSALRELGPYLLCLNIGSGKGKPGHCVSQSFHTTVSCSCPLAPAVSWQKCPGKGGGWPQLHYSRSCGS